MIRPRPTQHVNGVTSHNFHTFTTNPSYEMGRQEAWCPCGARLSRYRALGDTLCAPCQHTKSLNLEAEDLHPPVILEANHQRWRSQASGTCPICGGWMDRRAKTCRHCV